MDSLQQLPENKNTVFRPDEEDIMNSFFGDKSENQEDSGILSKVKNTNFKLIASVIAVFALISSPFVTPLLQRSESDMINFGIKVAVFSVLTIILFILM